MPLVPVLMGYFIRGKIPSEAHNPLIRILIALYRPLLNRVLSNPGPVLLLSLLIVLSISLPLFGIKGLLEFLTEDCCQGRPEICGDLIHGLAQCAPA